MTASYPKALRIGPFTYRIKRWKNRPADNAQAWGLCDRKRTTILIHEGLSPEREREVVLHEVLHACWDVAGLNLLAEAPEEAAVNGLAFPLLGVLRDNPELVAYLQAG